MKFLSMALLALGATSSVLGAGTIDFEQFDPGNYASLSDTVDGVSVSIGTDDGTDLRVGDTTSISFPSNWGERFLRPIPGQYWIVANFGTPTDFVINSFSLECGDFGIGAEAIWLQAYDGPNATGNLVDEDLVLDYSGNLSTDGSIVMYVSGTGIESVRFQSFDDAFPNDILYDNLTVNPVPEPATLAVIALGSAFLLKRRKK